MIIVYDPYDLKETLFYSENETDGILRDLWLPCKLKRECRKENESSNQKALSEILKDAQN